MVSFFASLKRLTNHYSAITTHKMLYHKLFSTTLGIGYIKGGGTLAAIACCICWYLAWHGDYPPVVLSVAITLIITFLGVWSSTIVEKTWGKDPSRVVIDEVAGMCIGLLFLPVQLRYVLCALVLFRFFDIAKPLYIRKMEQLPGGWGIMMDDLLAGIYTNILISAVVWFKLF
jgi:phosphatidylglycerophosphatase A